MSNQLLYIPPADVPVALSGTYTPTLTNTLNITGSTARQLTYLRTETAVVVGGQVDIKAAGAGTTTLSMSLPVASNFSTVYQAGSTAAALTGTGALVAIIQANATSNLIEITYNATDTATRTFMFTFIYEII